MTRIRITGPAISHLGDAAYGELFQKMAKTKCDICQRLFGEHSPEEFTAHAVNDLIVDLDIMEKWKKVQ